MKSNIALVMLLSLLMIPASSFADVPVSVTQQGRLFTADGEPETGELDLQFSLYDAPEGGALLWSDEITADLGEDGFYSVVLGTQSQPIDASLLESGEIYLALAVNRGEELQPRLSLTAVPFAMRAQYAEQIPDGALSAASLADGSITSEKIDAVTWDKLQEVPAGLDDFAGLNCVDEQVAGFDGARWVCRDLPEYSGANFALSDTNCAADEVVIGIAADGTLVCTEFDPPEYTAGTGLNLSTDDRFSLDLSYVDDRFVRGDTLVTQNMDGRLVARGLELTNANLIIENSRAALGVRSPLRRLHVKGAGGAPLLLESPESRDAWALGIPGSGHLTFYFADLNDGSSAAGRAAIHSDSGDYITYSDRKLKDDIQPLDSVLHEILSLEPSSYFFRNTTREERFYGFVAQDVQKYFPSLVHENEDGYLSLAYSDFTVLAIQAAREQQVLIEAQQAENDQLRQEVRSLEDRIRAIEAQLKK